MLLSEKREKNESLSPFFPPHAYREVFSAEDLLRWNSPSVSEEYFRSILTKKEEVILEGYYALDNFSAFGETRLPFVSTSTPLRWQMVLESLRVGGVPIRRTGLFSQLYNDVPKRYQAVTLVDTPDGFSDGKTFKNGIASQGIADDPDIAVSKAIGEMLERYFLTIYRRKDLYFATVAELRNKKMAFLDPLLYPQWNAQQLQCFPERFLDDTSRIGWIRGVSLLDTVPTWLPAQMVYWNYRFDYGDTPEPMILEPNTNGAGAHFTRAKALLSGLRELIQRDAFLIFWLRKRVPPRIDRSTIQNPRSKKLLADFERYSLRVEICDVTIDTGEAVIIVGIFDESAVGPALSIAGGCHRKKEKAIEQALYEALACYRGNRRRFCSMQISADYKPFFSPDIDHFKRVNLASQPERLAEYEWFFQGMSYPLEVESAEDITSEDELRLLLDVFRAKGWPVYAYTVSNPLLKKIRYQVVRVVVPNLISLFLNETNAPLQHSRLTKDFPQDLMPESDGDDLNITPHPFP